MPSELRSPRLAVLIDADNASAKIADGLFEEIAKIGEASVRRIYGDFSNARSRGWADILSKHAIIPQQQFAYTTGKNASDITLVIDAMDLLHSGRFDGFCLVSSDSDFTRLAARIREQGVDVFGFGEQKTPEKLQAGLPKVRLHREPACRPGDHPGRRLEIDIASAARCRHAHHQEGHHPDGERGRLGRARGSRAAARQSGVRFRSENVRVPQAERPRAKDQLVRDRRVKGPLDADSGQARCRSAAEKAEPAQACKGGDGRLGA
ncbi:hypothetical protein ACVMHR_004911 [Bradyrhizobium diazoefficiens]